ncbi:MAG TPA: hypothetical protein PLK77_16915, partial [Pyrinomonadaceae bacterium]|nr:hypothetical protein [Pyrinomonadaceae bacterium]
MKRTPVAEKSLLELRVCWINAVSDLSPVAYKSAVLNLYQPPLSFINEPTAWLRNPKINQYRRWYARRA